MIRVSEPAIEAAEISRVVEALRAGQVSSTGPEVENFERAWAEYCGRRHGVAVSSGTTALQLAVACLGLQPGDEIVMPSFTIISCALAAVYAGAVPRFVDADPVTWCMDVDSLRNAIGPRTRAIMPVHIYGHPVAMDAVLDLADAHGLAVIEDAAQAHGAQYLSRREAAGGWRRCGSFGTVSCFSFYANKLVTTGEGGMLLTDDEALAQRARRLRNLAFGNSRRFRHDELGFNFRMTNLQAALGIPQVARMETIMARKRSIAAAYAQGLANLRGVMFAREMPWARSVFWMSGLVIDPALGVDGQALAERLLARGVETRPFFLGLHEQPVLREMGLAGDRPLPVTERLARQGLYLPSGIGLTSAQVDAVIAALRECL